MAHYFTLLCNISFKMTDRQGDFHLMFSQHKKNTEKSLGLIRKKLCLCGLLVFVSSCFCVVSSYLQCTYPAQDRCDKKCYYASFLWWLVQTWFNSLINWTHKSSTHRQLLFVRVVIFIMKAALFDGFVRF